MSLLPSGKLRAALRALLRADEEGERCLSAMTELVRGVRADRILDVGCGDGRWLAALARERGLGRGALAGIELHPPLLAAAKERFDALGLDLERERWPFEDGSFDLVVINQVVEHLKNVYFCLSEAERVAKVGGFVAIGIPNLSGLVNRAMTAFGAQPICIDLPGPHVRAFAHAGFRRFLASNPAFELVRTLGSSLYPLPWPLLESAARVLPGWAAYTFYLVRKREARPVSGWLDFGDPAFHFVGVARRT